MTVLGHTAGYKYPSRLLPVASVPPTRLQKTSAGQVGHEWLLNSPRVAVELLPSEIQDALRSCLSRRQQWLHRDNSPGDLTAAVGHSPVFSPAMGAPHPVLHCGGRAEWVRLSARIALGRLMRRSRDLLSRQGSQQASLNPSLGTNQHKHSSEWSADSSEPCSVSPGCSPPVSSHFSSESPTRGTCPHLISFRSYNYLCIFLIALVVQALSVCQFPDSFQ